MSTAFRFRGDSSSISIPLINPSDGTAYTPTGPLLFTLKDSEDEFSASLVEKLSNVGGLTLANPAVVTFVSEDYADLVSGVTYYLSVKDTTTRLTVARGTVLFESPIASGFALTIDTTVVDPASPYLSAEEIEANRAAAEAAQTAAEAAQTAAEAAQAAAEAAKTAAELAKINSEAAQTAAETAQSLAETARTAAQTAKTAAEAAQAAALVSQNAAATSATAAANSATAASTSATNAASSATAAANSATAAAASAASVNAAELYARDSGRAPRPGIVSAGTSAIGTTQDNTGLAIGAGAKAWWHFHGGARPSHTTLRYLGTKFASNLGWKVEWDTSDLVRLRVGNGSNFTTYAFPATVATGLTVGVPWTLDLVADFGAGTLDYYLNGAPLGTQVNISAATAQTLDSTGPLLWGSDGTTHFAGQFSDGWLAKTALPTAAQLANIYRAGTVAGFCSWTLNTTTGQLVPALGSTVFLAWPDFGRADPVNNPIAWDRSSNNQHAILGTSGLTQAVPLTWRNTAPATALVSDGSNGTFVRNTLNTQNPGTGDFVFGWRGIYPQDATSSDKILAFLSSSTSTTAQVKAAYLGYHSTVGTVFAVFGSSGTTHYRQKVSASVHAQLVALGARGIEAALFVVRTSSGLRICLGIGRDSTRFGDVTNLFAETTNGGSPPAWTDEVNGVYLGAFYNSSTSSSAHLLSDLRLANVAMTEAQLRTEYERVEPGPEWVGASKTPSYTANWTVNTDSWGGTLSTTSGNNDSVSDGTTSKDDCLLIRADTTNSSNHYASRTGLLTAGKTYRIQGYYYIPSTAPTAGRFSIGNGSTVVAALGVKGVWTAFSVDLVASAAASSTGEIRFYLLTSGGGGYAGASGSPYDDLYVQGVTITPLGITTRLRTDTASDISATNGAASATNDASDFTFSTTGITVSPSVPLGTRRNVRATFLHSAISTGNGTTTFFSLPAGWALVDFQANVDAAFDIGTTISVGTSASPTRWVNVLAVDTTGLKQQTSGQLYPQSLTAVTTVYIKKSGSTTFGDILTCAAVIERKY